MGTTIRRTPITTNIPAAPDYKFLNLASFGGIVETDNPFTAETNSASDALNVYVDEYNALTTRPRVASRFLLGNAIDGTILNTFSIENSLYIKSKISDVVRMYKIDNLYSSNPTHTLLTNDTGVTLTEGEFSVIRYEGNDFILNDENILINDNGTLKDVKNWSGLPIPLTIERNVEGQKGVEVAKKSVFTNKHRESFELDNLETDWVYDEIQKTNARVYKNDYCDVVKNTKPIINDLDQSYISLYHLFDDNSYVFAYSKNYGNNGHIYVGVLKENKASYTDTNIVYNDVGYYYTCSKYNNRIVIYSDRNFTVVYKDPTNNQWITGNTYTLDAGDKDIQKLRISPDGNKIVLITYDRDNPTPVVIEYNTITDGGYSYSRVTPTYSVLSGNVNRILDVKLSYNNDIFFFCDNNTTNAAEVIKRSNDTNTTIITTSGIFSNSFVMSGDGNVIVEKKSFVINNPHKIIKYVLSENVYQSTEVYLPEWIEIHELSYDGTKALGVRYLERDENIWKYSVVLNGSFATNEKSFIDLITADKLYENYNTLTTDMSVNKSFEYIIYGAQKLYSRGFDVGEIIYSKEPLLELLYTDAQDNLPTLHLTKSLVFDNSFWYYSPNSNVVRWSKSYNPLEISVSDYNNVGDNTNITNALIISENTLALFKKDKTYAVTPQTIADRYTYTFNEIVNDYGCVSTEGAVISPIKNIPLVVSTNEISALYSSKSIGALNRYFTSLTINLNKKYNELKSIDEDTLVPETIKAMNVKYWSLFIQSHNNIGTKMLVYDDRIGQWFYWTLPFVIDYCWTNNGDFYFMSNDDKIIYTMLTSDIINYEINPDLKEYYDEGRKLINWYWKTQILPFNTINYSKRLVNTTFILSDNDVDEAGDGYAINYKFTAWKKTPLVANPTTVSNELLKLVQSITKRTVIPRFNFLQLELSNIVDDYYDSDLDNNKFRLIGLGFKYVLLGGLY